MYYKKPYSLYSDAVGGTRAEVDPEENGNLPGTEAMQTGPAAAPAAPSASAGNAGGDPVNALYGMLFPAAPAAPVYGGSQWDSVLNNTMNRLQNTSFEQWAQGDDYSALAKRYGEQGRMGMQDVLGLISSRTGGLASSYATTAAQQQYNELMGQLQEVARQMYEGYRGDLKENAQMAQSMAQRDYNSYLDQYGGGEAGGEYAPYGSYSYNEFDGLMERYSENDKAEQAYDIAARIGTAEAWELFLSYFPDYEPPKDKKPPKEEDPKGHSGPGFGKPKQYYAFN